MPAPGYAIIGPHRWRQWTERYARVGQFFDVLARQRDTQTFGHERHEAGLQLRILQNPRPEARRLAGFAEPVAKTGMGLLGHADKKHRFQVLQMHPRLPEQWMF